MSTPPCSLLQAGSFTVGCNYWASHAGTHMWRQWDADVVTGDMQQLALEGMQVLRVFPLWPDFQPLDRHYTIRGRLHDLRHGEQALARTDGINVQALEHFMHLADQAQAHGLQLVVGLVTGWMSGRWFVPPALESRNPITDPESRLWQQRFVRGFVEHFKDHQAITAWDLGNECNCLGKATREEAWCWTDALASAIRVADPSRPVISGMHSLTVHGDGPWSIADQAELTDILTTHPYPQFTPYCDIDPVSSFRGGLHAAIQTQLYGDIGCCPAFAEETGTLGGMIADEHTAANYISGALWSLWANDCRGMLWWCAYDQDHLDHGPYDWNAHERDLGLIRADRDAKPVIKAIAAVNKSIAAIHTELAQQGLSGLPKARQDAVCILTPGQDQWGAAYAAAMLARQAGYALRFAWSGDPLPESNCYLAPCLSGHQSFSKQTWQDLDRRIRKGATFYCSFDKAFLQPFDEWAGLRIVDRSRRSGPAQCLGNKEHGFNINDRITAAYRYTIKPADGTKVLASEADGNPILTQHSYGHGQVFCLLGNLELDLVTRPGHFTTTAGNPSPDQEWWRLYKDIIASAATPQQIDCPHPGLCRSWHVIDATRSLLLIINPGNEAISADLTTQGAASLGQVFYGQEPTGNTNTITVAAHDATILEVLA